MKMSQIAVLSLALLLAASVSGHAEGEEADKIDQRQDNQEKRIEEGKKSGALTKHEAARLEGQQNKIGQAADKAESDGTVTKKEARRLNKMQNKASKTIRRQKRDRQHR
jgi:hypothetical protein